MKQVPADRGMEIETKVVLGRMRTLEDRLEALRRKLHNQN